LEALLLELVNRDLARLSLSRRNDGEQEVFLDTMQRHQEATEKGEGSKVGEAFFPTSALRSEPTGKTKLLRKTFKYLHA